MKIENKVQLVLQIFIGFIALSIVNGYPQKSEDNNAGKPDHNSTSPSPTTTVATKVSALPTTVALTTITAIEPTTMSAIPSVSSSLATTIAIKPLENLETTSGQRHKRQATIPAFPTNALSGNGIPSNLGPPPNGLPTGNLPPPSGNLPPPSGSSLPQPNIASVGVGVASGGIPQTIASAAPLPAAGAASALQPVKFPQAGK